MSLESPPHHITELSKLDPLNIDLEVLFRKEDAVIMRMLSVWNPAWGHPFIVRRPTHSSDCRIESFGAAITSNLVGLCADTPLHLVPVILVWARDQLDADGNVLPSPHDCSQRPDNEPSTTPPEAG